MHTVYQASKRILVVDDEPELRAIYEGLLNMNGYHVTLESCGNRAVEVINSQELDLVITDLRMPDGNGLRVRDAAAAKGIPTIIVSGYADAYRPVLSSQDRVFAKPVSFDRLLDAIDATCAIKRK